MVCLAIIKPGKSPERMRFDRPAEVVVGRSTKNTIVLDFDQMVSRTHAVFLIEPPKISVRDLGSTNGLRVNGELHSSGTPGKASPPVDLRDGDEVLIGVTSFRVETGDERREGANSLRAATPVATGEERAQPKAQQTTIAAEPGSEETLPGVSAQPPHVPGYRLARHLGEGTSGRIYLGIPNGDARYVAIKVMFPSSGITQDERRLFFREFDLASNISHPNLARLQGGGELSRGGGFFRASEYVEGEDLARHIARHGGRLLSGQALGILAQIAGAIDALHKNGMIHLDLKPSSLIIRDDGRVVAKVADAGFPEFMEKTGLHPQPYPGSRQEKLGFLAPEQLKSGASPGMSADVFALCALLFYMLSGVQPYRFGAGDDRSAVARGDLLNIDSMAANAPERLRDIAKRGLSVNPGARFANAGELLATLESLLE